MTSRTPLQIALEIYDDARIRGLCHEGALEAALGAAAGVDAQRLLSELEDSMNYLPHKITASQPETKGTRMDIKRIGSQPSANGPPDWFTSVDGEGE